MFLAMWGQQNELKAQQRQIRHFKVVEVNVLAFSVGFSGVLAICLPGQICRLASSVCLLAPSRCLSSVIQGAVRACWLRVLGLSSLSKSHRASKPLSPPGLVPADES